MASLAVEVAIATSLREGELHRMRLAGSEFEAGFRTSPSMHDNTIEGSPALREAASGHGAAAQATTRLVQTDPVAARMDLVRVALVLR